MKSLDIQTDLDLIQWMSKITEELERPCFGGTGGRVPLSNIVPTWEGLGSDPGLT